MNVREYIPEDHVTLTAWWAGHGWPAIPQAVLPKLGIVVEHDGKPICAGFLYMDNSVGVCWLEWVVSNPDASPKHVVVGLGHLMAFMKERALAMDYGVMMTACRQQSLVKVYERGGFEVTDPSVTHLINVLRKKED